LSGCLSPSAKKEERQEYGDEEELVDFIEEAFEGSEEPEDPQAADDCEVEFGDKKISSGEIRRLMDMFGKEGESNEDDREHQSDQQARMEGQEEREETAVKEEEEEEEEITNLGAVLAGPLVMLGPWVDMDEDDVMYKVPKDKNGKVRPGVWCPRANVQGQKIQMPRATLLTFAFVP